MAPRLAQLGNGRVGFDPKLASPEVQAPFSLVGMFLFVATGRQSLGDLSMGGDGAVRSIRCSWGGGPGTFESCDGL